MKRARYWLLIAFAVVPGWAIPMPCIDNTLTAYIAPGFACTIGDKTFGSFATILSSSAVLGGMATPATADDITVHPTGGSSDPGFSFQAEFNAASPLVQASSVSFTVAFTGLAPAGDPFLSTSLFLTNPSASGVGSVTALEAICENGSFTSPLSPVLCTGIGVNTGLTSNITNGNLNSTVTFDTGPVTELGIIKQLTLSSAVGGTATASALNNSFTAATPEPSTAAMLGGLALVLLGVRLTRLRRAVL